MSKNLSARELKILGDIYRSLKSNFTSKSVLKKLLSSNKTKTTKWFDQSNIDMSKYNFKYINTLEKKGLIRKTSSEISKYSLTAHGLYEYEVNKKIATIDDLITEIDKQYVSKKEKIEPKDKLLLTTLVGLRFFSNKCYLQLDGGITSDNYYKIIKKSMARLVKNNLIDFKVIHAFEKRKNPADYMMARTSKLKKFTNSIFTNVSQGKRHWLEIADDNDVIDKEKLKYLFEILFKEKLTSPDNILDMRSYFEALINERYQISDFHLFNDMQSTETILKAYDEVYISTHAY
jgi:predicted transcriptional regulator